MTNSVTALTEEIHAYCEKPEWAQNHDPKEMAVAIAAGPGQLLRHYVWQDAAQNDERATARRAPIEDEPADVATPVSGMANRQGIDLAAAIRAKLVRNELRYPVETAGSSNRKYIEL